MVREWQARGAIHLHAIVRIVRSEAPGPARLEVAARTASGFSLVDGALVLWGDVSDCRAFRADGDGAKTIWYLSKGTELCAEGCGEVNGRRFALLGSSVAAVGCGAVDALLAGVCASGLPESHAYAVRRSRACGECVTAHEESNGLVIHGHDA